MVDTLPDDPESLKALLLSTRKEVERLTKQVHDLFEALRLERHRHYGTKSEKHPGQGELFDEAESEASQESDADSTATSKPAKKHKRGIRKPLPTDLPRIEHVHELPANERHCPCGCELTEIGEEVSEQLDIVPAKVQVIRTIRKKYACRECEETIKSAAMPPLL